VEPENWHVVARSVLLGRERTPVMAIVLPSNRSTISLGSGTASIIVQKVWP